MMHFKAGLSGMLFYCENIGRTLKEGCFQSRSSYSAVLDWKLLPKCPERWTNAPNCAASQPTRQTPQSFTLAVCEAVRLANQGPSALTWKLLHHCPLSLFFDFPSVFPFRIPFRISVFSIQSNTLCINTGSTQP